MASFDDDAGDATGPGSYRKPGDTDLVDGDFDLRRFTIHTDGDEVIFEVTLGASFREPTVTARNTVTQIPLWNHIFLQNIDIYIDTDPTSSDGSSVCIPGRRVAFPKGRTWKRAVVLTPQPGPTREIVREAFGDGARRVIVPDTLTTRMRTVIARIPSATLGGRPDASWGYSVHVSGARWERSFDVSDRLLKRNSQPNAFTMDVKPIPDAWAFGGAPAGDQHPRVIDVLLPRGVDQSAVLGGFGAQAGSYARVPFVSIEVTRGRAEHHSSESVPTARAEQQRENVAVFVVMDISEHILTLAGDTRGVAPMMIGQVYRKRRQLDAKLVVERVLEAGIVARVLSGGEQIVRGDTVSFSK